MIQPQTRLRVADNSGAKEIMCIRVMGGGAKKYASVGDVIIAAVKQAQPNQQVKNGEVVRAVVVRQAKEYRRSDGSHIRFDDNAAVIINPQNNPGAPVSLALSPANFVSGALSRFCHRRPRYFEP